MVRLAVEVQVAWASGLWLRYVMPGRLALWVSFSGPGDENLTD
jgi:hypothetical protein